MRTKPYPRDLTDARWATLEPHLPPAQTRGRPRTTDLREGADAISYRHRNGCLRRALPHDSPPWRAGSHHSLRWTADGTGQAIHDASRPQVRPEAGREPTPAGNEYHNPGPNERVSEHGWYVIGVKGRPPGGEGVRVIKGRRVGQRTFAWPGRCRLHSRDSERRTTSSAAPVQISGIRLMPRRLAGEKDEAPFRSPRPARKSAA